MNITCIDAPADVSELALAELEPAQSTKVKPPRVAGSPVALECVLHSTVPLSSNQLIVLGRIVQAHVKNEIVLDPNEPLLDTNAMKLIGGMHGAKWYTRTSDLFCMNRPSWSDWVQAGKVAVSLNDE